MYIFVTRTCCLLKIFYYYMYTSIYILFYLVHIDHAVTLFLGVSVNENLSHKNPSQKPCYIYVTTVTPFTPFLLLFPDTLVTLLLQIVIGALNMDKSLYINLKKILKSYNFDKDANFYKLFRHAKRMGLRDLSFKQFTKHIKDMGVFSEVVRVEGAVLRRLVYDAKNDKYLKKVFPEFETCPNCKGVGVVRVSI